ncbi:MAG TPA: tRNA (N6-isopentenyl adenosine(37)-C2)-methylthiotransferase MiaB [Planctomycetota bacterium]|nr:tRNA (N6-isopentenyl adenosine(37)-C2)-methylthiotransferase MiaB [Planctomycetota bacterium]
MAEPLQAGVSIASETPATSERTVYLETFGCQMNSADSDVVLARLAEHGWRQVASVGAASLVLYNTCSVRDHAEARVRGRLGELKREKRERPGLTIGIMGCMAQREKAALIANYPHIDLVVGTDQFVHMPQLIDRLRGADGEAHVVETAFADWEDLAGVDQQQRWTNTRSSGVNAYVPVMRGCNYNCTYCVVPMTRGKEKSRRPEHIEDEVRRLVDQGRVQITLLGQTVDAYGKTLGDGTDLASLLRRVHAIDGLKRLRFVTSHPKDISDSLLDTMAELPKVAKHLHVPAQSGSDRMLRLMGRRYTRDDYLRFVDRARQRMPQVEFLSDFIVGFPREGEDDFRATASLMDAVRFDGSYVFTYSVRPGTPASHLDDDVPLAVKKARCNELLALQLTHQQEKYARLHGSVVEVLVEGPSKSDDAMLHGRSLGNLNIVFPRSGADGATRDRLIGSLVGIRIARSTSLTLFGDVA